MKIKIIRNNTYPTNLEEIHELYTFVGMLKIGRIGFLGGGKIAQAMAKGFIKAGNSRVLFSMHMFVEHMRYELHNNRVTLNQIVLCALTVCIVLGNVFLCVCVCRFYNKGIVRYLTKITVEWV